MPRWSRRNRIAVLAAGVSAVLAAAVPASSAAEEWAWPVRGSVITPYSNDNSRPYAGGMHRGIDISAPVGADVVAARAGKVTFAGALGSSGLTLAIETPDARYATSYLHLSSLAVRRGESVGAGQKVGEVGTSGRRSAAEPHLHFGVRLSGRENFYVDPLTLLPPLAGVRTDPAPSPLPVPAPLRMQVAPVPARARAIPVASPPHLLAPRAVPAGPNPEARPNVRSTRVPVPAARDTGRSFHADDAGPIIWGPLASLAGVLLLVAVLARRFLLHELTASGTQKSADPGRRGRRRSASRVVERDILGAVD